MVENIRNKFIGEFSEYNYSNFLEEVNSKYNVKIPFRIAESPVFIPNYLKNRMLNASEKIVDFICSEEFESIAKKAIPKNLQNCRNVGKPTCLAFDFAITKNSSNSFDCKLIELQAALSLFGFTELMANKFKQAYPIISNLTQYLSGLNKDSYLRKLKEAFLGELDDENVVFLEIKPKKQQNRIDYLCLEDMLNIKTICVSDLRKKGKNLFYPKEGKLVKIHRIINRVILEEFERHPDLKANFSFNTNYQVEWVNHPTWFFKISKFLLPYLRGNSFVNSYYLNEVEAGNVNLKNMVLKPIFSLGGKNIQFDVSDNTINKISQKEQYILQEKVKYDFCVKTNEKPVKAEVRIMYVWEANKVRPIPVISFSRFTRGNQMALRYNKSESWVGASTCFYES